MPVLLQTGFVPSEVSAAVFLIAVLSAVVVLTPESHSEVKPVVPKFTEPSVYTAEVEKSAAVTLFFSYRNC